MNQTLPSLFVPHGAPTFALRPGAAGAALATRAATLPQPRAIVIVPYAAPSYSAYEQYLRQYNVTPGDSGTAPGEDWDGDGALNTNEFNALTNPYDPLSHP